MVINLKWNCIRIVARIKHSDSTDYFNKLLFSE